MALRLKIVSDNAAATGDHPRWTFGVNGGRIGRNSSNDWVLRDPDRYVSGRHAEIEHRAGAWLLRDTSTNGTFVNDSDEALGPDRVHQLSHGDRFRIGSALLEVSQPRIPCHKLALRHARAAFGKGVGISAEQYHLGIAVGARERLEHPAADEPRAPGHEDARAVEAGPIGGELPVDRGKVFVKDHAGTSPSDGRWVRCARATRTMLLTISALGTNPEMYRLLLSWRRRSEASGNSVLSVPSSSCTSPTICRSTEVTLP